MENFFFDHWEMEEMDNHEDNEEIEETTGANTLSSVLSAGNLVAEWFGMVDLDPSSNGFVAKAKKIRFAQTVAVILIPSRTEYLKAGLCLWYDRISLKHMQTVASRELKQLMNDTPLLTTEAAIVHLYQPSIDVIYRNVKTWFRLKPMNVMIVDHDEEHAQETIDALTNSQRSWKWKPYIATSTDEAMKIVKQTEQQHQQRNNRRQSSLDLIIIDESIGDRSEMSHRDGQRGGGLGMGALITILRRIYGETVFLGCIAGTGYDAKLTTKCEMYSNHLIQEAKEAGCDFVWRQPVVNAVSMLPIVLATRMKTFLKQQQIKEQQQQKSRHDSRVHHQQQHQHQQQHHQQYDHHNQQHQQHHRHYQHHQHHHHQHHHQHPHQHHHQPPALTGGNGKEDIEPTSQLTRRDSVYTTSWSDDASHDRIVVRHGGSISPNSHGGSISPNSHGGSISPNSHGGSHPPNSVMVDKKEDRGVGTNGEEKMVVTKVFQDGLVNAPLVLGNAVLGNYADNVHAMGADISAEIRSIHNTITPVIARCNSSEKLLSVSGDELQRQGQGPGLGLTVSSPNHTPRMSSSNRSPVPVPVPVPVPMSNSLILSHLNINHVGLRSSVSLHGVHGEANGRGADAAGASASTQGATETTTTITTTTTTSTTSIRVIRNGPSVVDDGVVGMDIPFAGTVSKRSFNDAPAPFLFTVDDVDVDDDIDALDIDIDDGVSELMTPCSPQGTPQFRHRKSSLSPTTLAVVIDSLTNTDHRHNYIRQQGGHVDDNNGNRRQCIERLEQPSSSSSSVNASTPSIPTSAPTTPHPFKMENNSRTKETSAVPLVPTEVSYHTHNDEDDDDVVDVGEDDDDVVGDDDVGGEDDIVVTNGVDEMIVIGKNCMVKSTSFSEDNDFDNSSETTVGGVYSQPSVVTTTTQKWRT